MKRSYRVIGEQSYDTIGEQSYDTIPNDIERLAYNRQEVRFARVGGRFDRFEGRFPAVKGKELMYETSVLERIDDLPSLDGHQLRSIGESAQLAQLLRDEFKDPKNLPQEVRVTRPKSGGDYWGVFVRR